MIIEEVEELFLRKAHIRNVGDELLEFDSTHFSLVFIPITFPIAIRPSVPLDKICYAFLLMLAFDSLRLTMPYSGVISPAYVDMDHDGDVYGAFDTLFGGQSRNRQEILDKAPLLEEASLLARAGISESRLLSELAPHESRWSVVGRALSGFAQKQATNPSDESLKLKDVIDAAHGDSE